MTSEAMINAGDHNELVYVGDTGTITYCFGYQPTTDDIAQFKQFADAKRSRYCVQKVGEQYEVYDLTTIRRMIGETTIGLPVFTHHDADAAIMWALMNL